MRLATAADRALVSRLLAAAFFDDAAITYIFPDPTLRRARLPDFFGYYSTATARLVPGS